MAPSILALVLVVGCVAADKLPTLIASGLAAVGLVGIAIICFQWYKLRKLTQLFQRDCQRHCFYRLVAEYTTDIVFITDSSCQNIYITPSIERLLGYTPQEFLKLTPAQILAQESCQRFIDSISGRIDTTAEQFKMRHRNGKEIWGILSSNAIHDETTGKFNGTVNVLQDISKHIQIERQVQKQEQQYQLIFEHASNLILALSPPGQIIDCNDRVEQYLGCDREDIIGKPLTGFFYQQEGDKVQKLVNLTSGSSYSNEYKLVRKDGNIIDVKIDAFAFFHQDYLHKTICLIDDITLKRKQQKEQLMLQKLDSIQTFISGMAHDFNNILAGILGNIELAQLQLATGEKAYQKLSAAKEACSRANDLTWQFLTLFSEEKPDKTGAIDWLIREAIKSSVSRKKDIQCESDIASDLAPVCHNAFQLKQALDHLLTNAVESMPGGGNITIQAKNIAAYSIPEESNGWHVPKKCVKIAISDQGIGIPGNDLPKIFDPYFSRKQVGGRTGIGMGLTMVYSIIKRHHGYIEVTSTPDQGSTFFVYLPAACPPLSDSNPIKVIGGHGKILVMDDEQIVRDVAAEMLQNLGYQVDLASGATEAINLYQQSLHQGEKYQAIILDLTISGSMKGDEVLARIKELDSEVKAIVSTGYANDDVLQNYQKYGFCAAMPKPYKFNKLAKVIQKITNAVD